MLKQLGLIAIISMWAGTYVLVKRHSLDPGKTISKHASKSVRYHITFGILELVVVSLFSLFIFGWFIPTFKLGSGYGITAMVGFIGTVIAAVVPDRGGWQGKLHGLGAYGMAMSLMAMNLFLVMSNDINLVTRIILYISLAYMIVGTIVAIVWTPLFRRNALRLQVIFFLAFHIPILLAVYS